MTRAPATWARHDRSRSSPGSPVLGLKPPNARHRSVRTRTAPAGATKTSRATSCWPWSSSPSSIREIDDTHPVSSHADRQQPVRSVPEHELRAGQAGVAPVRLFKQQADGVGGRGDVVVANEDMGRALAPSPRPGWPPARNPVAGAGPGQVRLGQAGGHPVGDGAVVVTDGHHEDRKLGVVLCRQGPQRFLQPGSRPTGHDHCHHGGCARLSHHQRSRA